MKASYKRRIYLINKDFQIKFIVYTATIAVITLATFYGMLYFFFDELVTLGVRSGFPAGHVYFRFIADNRTDMMNVYYPIASIAVFIIIFVSGIFFSHKIAGPIYRMNTYLRSLSLDTLTSPLSFRKKDFFQELSKSYNKRISFLRNLATTEPDKLIEVLKYKDGEKRD
jgi:methyl-accepting chemotaxis protein